MSSAQSRTSPTLPVPALAAGCLAVGVGVSILAADGARATTHDDATTALIDGIARGALTCIPLAVACYAARRPSSARFGRLLAAWSAVWVLSALATSSDALVHSIGMIAGWSSAAGLCAVLLAFPTGRLESRVDRWIVLAAALVLAVLFLPTALLMDRFEAPVPWSSCMDGCPDNALQVVTGEPAVVASVVRPLRETLAALIFLGVAARLLLRLRGRGPLMRRALSPVFVAAGGAFLLLTAQFATRALDPHSDLVRAAEWLSLAGPPAVALAFLLGLVQWRLFIAKAIVQVSTRLGPEPTAAEVRDVVADAFDDAGLEIGRWLGDAHGGLTTEGRPLVAPGAGSGRHLSEVRDGGGRSIAIVHDSMLRGEDAFIETTGRLAAGAFERQRSSAHIKRVLADLQDSRTRILTAADSERRRIERDLHDGAQQRLVALRIELQLAAEQAADEGDLTREHRLLRLGASVEDALDEMRSLTRGIYPAMLDHGLEGAIRSAALRCPADTVVECDGLGTYREDVAVAAYFCVVEALQNVAKHAGASAVATVRLHDTGDRLRLSVSDTGVGFAADEDGRGVGMTNMLDRVATLGGALTVRSQPGHGTTVSASIPLAASAP